MGQGMEGQGWARVLCLGVVFHCSFVFVVVLRLGLKGGIQVLTLNSGLVYDPSIYHQLIFAFHTVFRQSLSCSRLEKDCTSMVMRNCSS